MSEKHGFVHTVKVIKQLQLHLTRYLSGNPLLVNDIRIGITKKGLPRLLWLGDNDLQRSLMSEDNHELVRSYLTVLNISRTFLGDGTLDVNSITTESSSSKEIENDISSWFMISSMRREYFSNFDTELKLNEWKLPHISTKAGPNGQAMGSSLRDLQLLTKSITESIYILGGKYLKDYMITLKDSIKTIPDYVKDHISNKSFTRRISVVSDKGLKNRPIAILDYWSQTSLIPIHKTLYNTLNKIKMDCTYDQMKLVKDMFGWETFHCFDLSAATDRFPISLQTEIIAILTSKEYACAWKEVMIKLPFYAKGIGLIRYKSGQPMGAYSSWATFAITHHIVMGYSAFLCGIESFKDYAILGDDVVIGNGKVAAKYREVINGLGVEISDMKSHHGSTLCDFAKNLWIRDSSKTTMTNVTGVPLSGILETWGNPFLLSQELSRLIERGTLDVKNVPVSKSLLDLFSETMSKRSQLRFVDIIQKWWSCVETLNWVKTYRNMSSPRQLHCNKSRSYSYDFLSNLLREDFERTIEQMRKDLIKSYQEADRLNDIQYNLMIDYHNKGPDPDSLPNLGGIMYQPWYRVMEQQVKECDDLYESLMPNRFQRRLSIENWEEVITKISRLRISSPTQLKTARMSKIVLLNKRKQYSVLAPFV
jgi:hypothetical protein